MCSPQPPPGLHKDLHTLPPAWLAVNLSAMTFCSIIIMVCSCIIVGIITVIMVYSCKMCYLVIDELINRPCHWFTSTLVCYVFSYINV